MKKKINIEKLEFDVWYRIPNYDEFWHVLQHNYFFNYNYLLILDHEEQYFKKIRRKYNYFK